MDAITLHMRTMSGAISDVQEQVAAIRDDITGIVEQVGRLPDVINNKCAELKKEILSNQEEATALLGTIPVTVS